MITIQSRKYLASSRNQHRFQQRQRQPQLSMVIDRLSDECIGAIQSAHTLGNDIVLTVLHNGILFAWVVYPNLNELHRHFKSIALHKHDSKSQGTRWQGQLFVFRIW
jgi:hypothetical protein